MKIHPGFMVCIAAMLTCSIVMAQPACDYTAVGPAMEGAAARADWAATYRYARQIVEARPDDISTLSAEHKYFVGLAHAYLMEQAFGDARDELKGEHAKTASALIAAVKNLQAAQIEEIRTVSNGEQVQLEDFLVAGQTVLFDFTSEYCPPCRAIAPDLERLAMERDDVVLVKVNINRPGVQAIDWESPVAQQYNIHGIPYFKIYGPDGTLQAEGGPARNIVGNWIDELEG